MGDPAISVVIPAYNAAATLPRALETVFAQTCRDLEILVIDDGSQDDTPKLLNEYRDRVRVIHQSNQGAAAARNHGVREARGRLIAFLDADDFWHSRKLELQLGAFAAYPDIALCWTGHGYWNEGNPKPDLADVDPGLAAASHSRDFNRIFLAPYLGTPGVMMPRQLLIDLGGFREDLHTAEDVDMWLRAAYRGATASIAQPLFFVVRAPNSLTARHKDGTFRDNLRVIDDFCVAQPQFAAGNRSIVKRARAHVLEEWGSSALQQRDWGGAARLLRSSLHDRIGTRALYLWLKAIVRAGPAGRVQS